MAGLDKGAIGRVAFAGTILVAVGTGLAIGSIEEAIIIAGGILQVRHMAATADGLRVVHRGWVAGHSGAASWAIIDSGSSPSYR